MDRAALVRRVSPLRRALESVVGGGRLRERTLASLLRFHYDSLLRRDWSDPTKAPHFFDHRISSFAFAMGTGTPFGYYRGYFAAELIDADDRLLDIGCGDGFFARRFFSPKCATVDAIDVDARAVAHASRYNQAPNIDYVVLDAAKQPFPRSAYDVVVWDGGLGHFPPESVERMLIKIREVLAPGGAFVGSESLGHEGHDHLQFFGSLSELCSLFREHFPHVELRQLEYEVTGLRRVEAFWRCAGDRGRLDQARWLPCAAQSRP